MSAYPALARGVLTIDLGAVSANWRQIADRVAPAACAAVVKADAYGLGIARVAPVLWAAGARTFFVSLLCEGVRLRELLPDATIYALNGLLPGTAPTFAQFDVRPVLGSLPEIAEWGAHCIAAGADLPAALHVDTGMNRHGLSLAEAREVAGRQTTLGFTPSLVLSHFACADTPAHPLNVLQHKRFAEIAPLFPRTPASLANSAGAFGPRDLHYDLVRPGIALYGSAAIEGEPPLAAVVRLEVPIVQVRDAKAGESVGYGAAHVLGRDSRIAILSAGYADGVLRAAGASDGRAGGSVVIAGRRCPILGRISMDLTAVDVTDLPVDTELRGRGATVLGDGIGVDELAARAGTIGHEILTSLGARYERHYRM